MNPGSSPARAALHRPRLLLSLTLGLALLVLSVEVAAQVAGARARAARLANAQGRPLAALNLARSALRLDRWNVDASRTRAVALKRLERWRDLDAATAADLAWHPAAADLLFLRGEALAILGRPAEAADALWLGFGRAPTPRAGALALWRLAMRSSAEAHGPADPRARAAARRVLTLAEPAHPASAEPGADAPAAAAEARALLAGAP